jgi:hypothetical protein
MPTPNKKLMYVLMYFDVKSFKYNPGGKQKVAFAVDASIRNLR